MKNYKIMVINPGSTSTKISMFENETCTFSTDVFHDSSVLKEFKTINDQLAYRDEVVNRFIEDNHLDLSNLDAIVGRGGGCYSVVSGIYLVDDNLINDTRENKGGLYHSSMLGVQMANELHKRYGGLMLMMDPPIVDELCDYARVTGIDGIYRKAVSHALNLKATAKKHAASINKKYEDCNFIVCHIDGGISITAHQKGKMIDGNDAGGGEGPFTPTRMGSMAVTDVIKYMLDKPVDELKSLCSQTGGLSNYFNTSSSDKIHKLVEQGDEKATLIWNAMIYQVIKYIGAMSTVLKGDVDGIILTGGLLRFDDVGEKIKQSCEWIAPVSIYVGEVEQIAMAQGALRVLKGEEKALTYPGKPVWNGFNFTK